MTPRCLQTQDLYQGANIDVEVCGGDDDVPTLDASATKQKKLAGADAVDGGGGALELSR
jgi:hypothetical protein